MATSSKPGTDHPEFNQRLEVSTTAARQATREGVGRYVLAISMTLVIIAFILAYIFVFA